MTSFGIVGSGWRTEFFCRVAEALPEKFKVSGIVARRQERGEELEARFGISTYRDLESMLGKISADFVITSVPWAENPLVLSELAAAGVPALSETPPAPDLEGLRRVFQLVEDGARIQVAEQYNRQPHHAARLGFVRGGLLGDVSHVQISACHGYHGISLIRHLLGVGHSPVSVNCRTYTVPVVAGPGRDGGPREERVVDAKHQLAVFDFNGKTGIYDFTGEQYFSFIRSQRVLVQGERGEIVNDDICYVKEFDMPIRLNFERHQAGFDGNLEGLHLKGIQAVGKWYYRNPYKVALPDEELALAALLEGMGEYVRGGEDVYSLADGCHDHYLNLLMAESAKNGAEVSSEPQPWST